MGLEMRLVQQVSVLAYHDDGLKDCMRVRPYLYASAVSANTVSPPTSGQARMPSMI